MDPRASGASPHHGEPRIGRTLLPVPRVGDLAMAVEVMIGIVLNGPKPLSCGT